MKNGPHQLALLGKRNKIGVNWSSPASIEADSVGDFEWLVNVRPWLLPLNPLLISYGNE